MSKIRTVTGAEGWIFNYVLTSERANPAEVADSFFAQKRYEQALRQYREAIQINPKDAHLHFNLAFTLFLLDRYEEAALSYREVLKRDPKSEAAQFNLGLTLWILNRNDEAAAALREAIRINPLNAEAQGTLGSVLTDLGRHAEAIAAFERALKIDPGYFDTREDQRKTWERSKALAYKSPTEAARQPSPTGNTTRSGSVRPPDATIAQTGSGFFVTDDGFFLTAAHVVSGRAISVKTEKGEFPAQVIKTDSANDIAVLKIAGSFSSLPLGSAATVSLGKSVFTIGYPNVTIQGVEPKLTKGEINALSGLKDDPRHFQTSVPVQPGNSGPLVDEFGNVIGLVVTKLDAVRALALTGDLPQNVNYAIKINYARVLLETIPEARSKLVPTSIRARPFDEVVKHAQSAAGLVLVRK
jgi:S1-C subfamily serine protease